MRVVIYFLFKEDVKNHICCIDNTKNKLGYNVNQYIITNQEQLPKSLYYNVEQIFYFKTQKDCFNKIPNVLDYLQSLNYTEFLVVNANKNYEDSELVFDSISTIKSNLAVITKLF